jgi:hypothetical protein
MRRVLFAFKKQRRSYNGLYKPKLQHGRQKKDQQDGWTIYCRLPKISPFLLPLPNLIELKRNLIHWIIVKL